MRVLEEPFITRSAILAVLRPGSPGTESPFRTLRHSQCASGGLRVDVRTALGQLLGSTHLYSTLNADAARAVRLQQPLLAKAFAARATELERSADAATIRTAVREIAGRMNADPQDHRAPVGLQRYAALRGRSSWPGIDRGALTREWLVHSAAWLSKDERGEISEAVTTLARAASEARADLLSDTLPPVSTFFGVVQRMDSSAAEVEGDDATRLVPRDDLERQGLAVIGQAVSLLCEVLPGGGSLVFPMPAVALEPEATVGQNPFSDLEEVEANSTPAFVLPKADHAWLDRGLARQPTAVPLAPIRSG